MPGSRFSTFIGYDNVLGVVFPRGAENLNKPLTVFDVWYFLSLSFGGTLQQVLTFLLFTQPSPGPHLTGTLQIYAGTFSQGARAL